MGCEPSNNLQRFKTQHIISTSANICQSQFVYAKLHSIFEDYQFLNFINRKQKTEIRRILDKKSGIMRVAKIYKRNSKTQQTAMNEINILKYLDHPNIIKILQYYLDSENIYLVFEEIRQTKQLFNKFEQIPHYTRNNGRVIIQQILQALEYCHVKGFSHLNLTPDHILIFKYNQIWFVKLIGFCEGFQYLQKRQFQIQTPIYLNQNLSSFFCFPDQAITIYNVQKVDIWMVGILLFKIITGMSIKSNISCKFIEEFLSINENSHESFDLLRKMLEKDPSLRFSAKQCLQHEYFKSYGENIFNWKIIMVYNVMHSFKQKHPLKHLFEMYMLHRFVPIQEQYQFINEFKKLDLNQNGKLEREQLIQSLLNNHKMPEQQIQKYTDEIFRRVDKNHNKSIEFSEFVLGTMETKKFLNQQNLMKIFKQIDEDEDGYISNNQIYRVIMNNYENRQSSTAKISFEDFKKLMIDLKSQ